MRFGITILPEQSWHAAEPMWRAAEAMGFDHAWTYDHITWSGLPESPWYAAIPTLTAAATSTKRIGLGTFVSSPNTHEPVQFQREIAALDDISRGRLLLGLGSGGDLDARATGAELTLRQRSARFAEFTGLLDDLMRSGEIEHRGEWYGARVATHTDPLRSGLPGDPRNRVPLIVAANGPKAIRLAVERGDGWMTYGGAADTDQAWWQLIADLSRRVDDGLAARGRERHTLTRYLNLDSAPTFSLANVAAFEDAVGRATDLGFTDVITHWPRPSSPYRGARETLETVAADVLPRNR